MAMHTDDQTADAVRNGDRVDGQTTTDSPGGLGGTRTPGDAASGATDGYPLPNGILLESLTERAIVRIEVGGEIGLDCEAGGPETICDDDVVISKIEGIGERAGFRFSGTMVDLEIVEGDVEVALDLHRDGPTARGQSARLSIHAQGAEVDYEFAASGGVEPASSGASRDGDDAPAGAAAGTVSGSGVDEYLVTGEITEFEASSDDLLVLVNDRVVEPDDLC